jgi:hypothetical protein
MKTAEIITIHRGYTIRAANGGTIALKGKPIYSDCGSVAACIAMIDLLLGPRTYRTWDAPNLEEAPRG